uniref:Bifunctional inhibitor/plant lipid transfer protein/seed storage helical domain-containing protein n=1 Tax=Nelumbo nucifera TaxID=4432 RepID=A0A822YMI6_NELNU|nr:TPA_asm: hypothetical protein HUJ06_012548 [Nelumbo nucifera]
MGDSEGKRSDVGMWAVVMVAILLIGGAREVEGEDTPSCASNLVACAPYLNSTKPPDSCCTPLRNAVSTQLECLCNLYKSPSLKAFVSNVTQALELPKYCGINGTISACNKAQAPTSTSTSVPSPPGMNLCLNPF